MTKEKIHDRREADKAILENLGFPRKLPREDSRCGQVYHLPFSGLASLCDAERVKRHVVTKERDSVGIPTRIARARNVRILISIFQESLPSRNPYAQSARINLLTVKTLALY